MALLPLLAAALVTSCTVAANAPAPTPSSIPGAIRDVVPTVSTPTAPPPPQPVPARSIARSTSRNWSGYVATGGEYTSVAGTWLVPAPDPRVPGIDATWVGIGGAGSADLIQAGTEATVRGDGTISYDAWIEMLPAPTRPIALTVRAGDTVTVTVAEGSPGVWIIELRNVTTAKSYVTTVGYDSTKSSAEWIEEAPSLGRSLAPLDSFGTVHISAAATVVNGSSHTLSGADARPVTMTNAADQPLAIPSGVGRDGASFSIERTTTQVAGGTGRRRG